LADGCRSARFHRGSKTPTRPFRTPLFAVLQGRMRFHDFCRECFNEHNHGPPEHPRVTESVILGRILPSIDRCFSIEGLNHRGYAGSGAEDHRTSTFPFEIAPKRDFAPTPIASGSSRREHGPLSCLESTRIKSHIANAAFACKARTAKGPCDARFPRRNPTFTNPRGLPS